MARNDIVWGIDIGNTSLKALRCRSGAEPGTMEAIGFDYIEHSKIMSQPGVEPSEIMKETLQTFLSRNSTRGDKVAISVSGQSTISRFLKLPPVDVKKVPDIIKFEAKQWFPFDLQDVIWDYQTIGEMSVEGGIVLDSEVGMFAMKRDIAMKTIAPYIQAGIDIDCIQSSPLAVYNFSIFDQVPTRGQGAIDPAKPPEHVVLLSIGTDATDVVITNGLSIWIRSIPIGGNQFTKALTKGLKLTFTKAESIKRNPQSAEDPKAVFQAMRPVFNDLLSEVHRSIEYYSSLNRKAKFGQVYVLGNTIRMPGLRQFLEQNLGYPVVRPTVFHRLTGDTVIQAAEFKDNIASFAVSYGMAAQLLGVGSLSTNLVPQDVVMDRLIREKKPWALAGAAAVLLGLTVQFAGASSTLRGIKVGGYDSAKSQAESVASKSSSLKSSTSSAQSEFESVNMIGEKLTSNVEGRVTWLELLRALNAAIPQHSSADDVAVLDSVKHLAEDKQRAEVVQRQNRLFISNITAQQIPDAAPWWQVMKDMKWYTIDAIEEKLILEAERQAAGGGADGGDTSATATAVADDGGMGRERALLEKVEGPPVGVPCRIVQLVGYHYHNSTNDKDMYGPEYVRRTLIQNLKHGIVRLPASMAKQLKSPDLLLDDPVSMRELGIYNPTLLQPRVPTDVQILDPTVVLQKQNEFRRMMLEKSSTSGGLPSALGSGGGDSSYGMGGAYGVDFSVLSYGLGSSGSGGRTTSRATARRRGNIDPSAVLDTLSQQMDSEDQLKLKRYDFLVQFVWVETPPNRRDELAMAAAEAEAAAAVAATDTTEGTPDESDATNSPTSPDEMAENTEPMPTE